MKKTTTVLTRNHGEQQWEVFAENNGLAVTLDTVSNNYTVTLMTLGYKLGYRGFRTVEAAKGFMDSVADLHDWKELKKVFTKETVPEGLGKKVSDNFKLWQANEDTDGY